MSRNFHFTLSASIDNMDRVVVVSAFTKQNEQQTNKYLSPRMINKSTDNSVNLTVNLTVN